MMCFNKSPQYTKLILERSVLKAMFDKYHVRVLNEQVPMDGQYQISDLLGWLNVIPALC